jgi:hypothetical protein
MTLSVAFRALVGQRIQSPIGLGEARWRAQATTKPASIRPFVPDMEIIRATQALPQPES